MFIISKLWVGVKKKIRSLKFFLVVELQRNERVKESRIISSGKRQTQEEKEEKNFSHTHDPSHK